MKTVLKEKLKKDPIRLQQELILLRDLDHPNIVKFYQTFEDGYQVHFVMEYCSGGNLGDYIKKRGLPSEERASRIMANAFAAVCYLHSKGIVHRDIKEENFLFLDKSTDAEIKLIDFGLSQIMAPQERLSAKAGTPLYMAPEVFQRNYDHRCDYWSLGVMMYIYLVGTPPIDAKTSAALAKAVIEEEPSFEGKQWASISPEAKDLCKKLLTKDPSKRISASEALQHPWIKAGSKEVSFDVQTIEKAFHSLRQFSSKKKFVKEVLKILVAILDDKHILPMKSLFHYFDKGRDGEITFNSLKKIVREINVEITDEELIALIQNMHSYGKSPSISYTEFVVATIDPKVYTSNDKLWILFKHFDLENLESISIGNLREEMARSGKMVRSEEIDEMLKEVNISDRRRINFNDFCLILKDKFHKLDKKPSSTFNI